MLTKDILFGMNILSLAGDHNSPAVASARQYRVILKPRTDV